ncbi:MAG TPA: toxin-antitoxin system HicB family antitoxin [Opitutaceae bacterium]|jgi:predicted HicB family RNase H-like nuclease
MKPTRAQIETAAKSYLKIVEWSEDDKCFIGSAPPLIGHSCHGSSEASVLAQLRTIVEEWVESLLADGRPLPKSATDREFSGKFVVRLTPETHRKVALKALARGDSLNQFITEVLEKA